MYLILDEKDLAGREILFVDFDEYEYPVIVTKDRGVHVQETHASYDSVDFDHFSERGAERAIFEDSVLLEKLLDLNVIIDSEVSAYKIKKEEERAERERKQGTWKLERERAEYERLKKKFEEK